MTNTYNPGSRFSLRSFYGDRIDPMTGLPGKFHSGLDFAAPAGTPIPSAASGKVVYSGYNKNLGNVVIVQNDTGDYSLYGHMLDGDRVKVGQPIWPGDTIGFVGSTGERTTGNHLHYSVITKEAGENITGASEDGSIGIKLNRENTIDPAKYTNYDATPRYLDETKRAEQVMFGIDMNPHFGGILPNPAVSLNDRFGNWGSAPTNTATPTASDRPDSFSDRFGTWGSVPAGPFGEIHPPPAPRLPSGRAALPLPQLPNGFPNMSVDWQAHFGQFPNNYVPNAQDQNASVPWYSSPALKSNFAPAARLGNTPSPVLPALEKTRSAIPGLNGDANGSLPSSGGNDVRQLSRRTYSQSSPFASDASASTVPFSPLADTNSAAGSLGIVSGQPMPQWAAQLPLADLFGVSKGSGGSDWSNLLASLVSPNPTQPEPPPQTADSGTPVRRLSRRILNQSPMPAFDPDAPVAPQVPSLDPDFSGGVLGRYAAMGIDPQMLAQPSPDDEDERANLRELKARLSSSGNIGDAVALYSARRSSWG